MLLLLLDANYLAASISFSRPSVGSGCKFKFGVLPFRTTLAAVLFRHPRLDVIEFALGTLGLTHSLTHTHTTGEIAFIIIMITSLSFSSSSHLI